VLHEVRTGPEYFESALHELHVRYTSFLLRTVKEAIAAGELRADTDVELVRSLVYGGIEHRMWGTLFGRGAVDIESTADHYTHIVLASLLPTPSVASVALGQPSDMAQLVHEARDRLERLAVCLARQEAPTSPSPTTARQPGPRRRKNT